MQKSPDHEDRSLSPRFTNLYMCCCNWQTSSEPRNHSTKWNAKGIVNQCHRQGLHMISQMKHGFLLRDPSVKSNSVTQSATRPAVQLPTSDSVISSFFSLIPKASAPVITPTLNSIFSITWEVSQVPSRNRKNWTSTTNTQEKCRQDKVYISCPLCAWTW